MKAFYVVAVVIAAAVASASAKATIQEQHPIDWYDCSRKADGNYVHPSDCTRFISCSGGIASERDCAPCTVDPRRCPEGRTVYNATEDRCLWADETGCETDPGSVNGTTRVTEVTRVTPTPTRPDDGVTETTDDGETTEATITTPKPRDRLPKEGEPCNPEECKNEGWCQWYFVCNKTTATWQREDCGRDLVWNNETSEIHGGNCDLWTNLRAEVEHEYRSDEKCLACFWKEQGKCNREYWYQEANLKHRNVLSLSCAEGLVFSQEKTTCVLCHEAFNDEDQPCCEAPSTP